MLVHVFLTIETRMSHCHLLFSVESRMFLVSHACLCSVTTFECRWSL